MRRRSESSGEPMPADAASIEASIQSKRQEILALRAQLRKVKNKKTVIDKLESKLRTQLGYAKHTISEIMALDGNWNEAKFYQSCKAIQPPRRGRPPRSESSAA